jgi:signal transduction histidine kinase
MTPEIPLTDPQRADAAHRLNNPLMIITASAELILLSTDNEENRHRAKAVLVAAKRLQDQLKALLGI